VVESLKEKARAAALQKALHEAGIEVILDMVFNHTGEGDEKGPTHSFRGLDNSTYYILDGEGRYTNFSGCGNTFNCNHPVVAQLIVDSLRYWVAEMHVDGFRFDLAATLAREFYDVDRLSAFFDLVQQDPVVSQVKLIAEPWDLGADRLPLNPPRSPFAKGGRQAASSSARHAHSTRTERTKLPPDSRLPSTRHVIHSRTFRPSSITSSPTTTSPAASTSV